MKCTDGPGPLNADMLTGDKCKLDRMIVARALPAVESTQERMACPVKKRDAQRLGIRCGCTRTMHAAGCKPQQPSHPSSVL